MIKVVKKGIALPFIIILASVSLILGALFLLDNKPKVISQNPTQAASQSPTAEIINTDEETVNWKTYSLNGTLSFKYPPDYSTFDSSMKNYPGVDVYDKEEHLGPANLYLSIKATSGGLSDYDAIYKDYTDLARENSTMENFPNGFKIIYRDKTGYKYQVDTFYKYKNGYVRAYYRSVPGIPSEVYDQILSTFKFLE